MAQTVVGLFDDRDDAQRAVKNFLTDAFSADKVSIITTDPTGEFVRQPIEADPGNQAGAGAATGLVSGAVIGGIFGLLVSAGVLLIPGVGILAAGPVAMTLAGAGIGAVGGGLLGALIGLGIPKEHVSTYAEAIRRGGCLVAVEVDDAHVAKANKIMKDSRAVDIHQRAAYYQSQGFTEYDNKAPVYTQEQIAEDRKRMQQFQPATGSASMPTSGQVNYPPENDQTLRNRFDAMNRASTLTYQQWEPAYRFGWQMGQDARYTNFNSSEPTVRQLWEQSNPGTYDMYRDAIYGGFDDAFARRTAAKLM
jgi:uncharacterized membrane protein